MDHATDIPSTSPRDRNRIPTRGFAVHLRRPRGTVPVTKRMAIAGTCLTCLSLLRSRYQRERSAAEDNVRVAGCCRRYPVGCVVVRQGAQRHTLHAHTVTQSHRSSNQHLPEQGNPARLGLVTPFVAYPCRHREDELIPWSPPNPQSKSDQIPGVSVRPTLRAAGQRTERSQPSTGSDTAARLACGMHTSWFRSTRYLLASYWSSLEILANLLVFETDAQGYACAVSVSPHGIAPSAVAVRASVSSGGLRARRLAGGNLARQVGSSKGVIVRRLTFTHRGER
jgi:hypothetical protein